MARHTKKRGGAHRGTRPAQAGQAPVRSAAMQAVFDEAARLDREAELRKDDGVEFRMKPKAVRRFERYAGSD